MAMNKPRTKAKPQTNTSGRIVLIRDGQLLPSAGSPQPLLVAR